MSKHKIAKVITSCSDCDHKRILIEKGGNTFYCVICAFSESIEESKIDPFLLDYSYDNPEHYKLKIPDNCPLEDYDSNKTTEVCDSEEL